MGLRKCTGWHFHDLAWPKVTAVVPISKNLFVCYKVRTTHRITTKRGSFVALVMVITWLDFGKLLFLANFLKKFRMYFFQGQTLFWPYLKNGWSDWCETKRKYTLVGYWVQYMTLTFDLTHDLDLGYFKVKFRNSSISRIVDLIDVNEKEAS